MNQTSEFDGRVIVITGAAGDIGRLACSAFLSAGAEVVGIDRDPEGGERLGAEVHAVGARLQYFAVDLGEPRAIEATASRVRERYGRVDVLVNNAGILGMSPILETSVEEWDRMQHVNMRSVFLMTRYIAPLLGEASAIVNVSSIAALRTSANTAAYSVSKAGVVTFTKVAAAELAPRTRVNVVCPGPLDTQMPRNFLKDHPFKDQINAAMKDATLLKRFGQPAEIVALLLFLASSKASYITGAVFAADGGFAL
jgi:NAD(P)-dependent dehydrogenase (short-subunit alcohol dehydrogenase family)